MFPNFAYVVAGA